MVFAPAQVTFDFERKKVCGGNEKGEKEVESLEGHRQKLALVPLNNFFRIRFPKFLLKIQNAAICVLQSRTSASSSETIL